MKVTVTMRQTVFSPQKELTFESAVNPPVKCCRCYPSVVYEDGFCGCCEFNHATGKRPDYKDDDYGF